MNSLSSVNTVASKQWATRPSDERFTSLYDLQAKTRESKANAWSGVMPSRALRFQPSQEDGGLEIIGPKGMPIAPTHWAFNQIAARAGAPAGYLRTLHPALVADNLNYSMGVTNEAEDIGALVGLKDGVATTLKAATGPKYGRVWNSAIADSLVSLFGDGVSGQWRVPGEFGKRVEVTKANTTIYGSDRDMFVFLADEENRVEIGNRRNGEAGSLARGFYVWNSETGASSFGMAAFLFDFVCKNRIIWGMKEFRQTRFNHTVSAPDKWAERVVPLLEAYHESAASPIEAQLLAAQNAKIDSVNDFLKNRSFSGKAIAAIQGAHMEEEGRPIESVWDAVTGITAYAKAMPFQDERVGLEREAGKILDLVAA